MPVYKDKTRGTWFYDFRRTVNGETYRNKKRGFASKTEALLAEQAAIENLGKENEALKDQTLDELSSLFFDYEKTKLKQTTYELGLRLYRCHIGSKLGHRKVSELNSKDLLTWKQNFIKSDLSESFYNKVITLFRRIIQFGINRDFITKKALIEDLEKVSLNKMVPERQVWTPEQINQFLAAFEKGEDKEYDYWLYFYAFANTGMRPNEFRALQVKDIQGDYLIVNKTITSKLKGGDVIQTPKTSTSVRRVLMPHEIIELLLEYTKGYDPDYFIFGKKHAFSESSLNRYLRVHAKVAGLQPIVLYGFRHSHATNLIKAGVPIKVVSQRLGHKNASTTMNVYWHLFQDDEQQVLAALKGQK